MNQALLRSVDGEVSSSSINEVNFAALLKSAAPGCLRLRAAAGDLHFTDDLAAGADFQFAIFDHAADAACRTNGQAT